MDRFAIDGHSIFCWPHAVDPTTCRNITQSLPWPMQQSTVQVILNDQQRADGLGALLVPFMPGVGSLRWCPYVTLTKAYKAPWHRDVPRGADMKLCLYLDDVVGAGTVFRSKDFRTELRPPHEQGTIVLFDVRIEHRTDDYDERVMRRVLGLRAISA